MLFEKGRWRFSCTRMPVFTSLSLSLARSPLHRRHLNILDEETEGKCNPSLTTVIEFRSARAHTHTRVHSVNPHFSVYFNENLLRQQPRRVIAL